MKIILTLLLMSQEGKSKSLYKNEVTHLQVEIIKTIDQNIEELYGNDSLRWNHCIH